jgi:hypothetical protein
VDIPKAEIDRCFTRGIFQTMAIQIESGDFEKWLKSQ